MMKPESFYTTTMESPVGPLLLTSDGTYLTGLYVNKNKQPQTRYEAATAQPFLQAITQLQEYFAGKRTKFDLPLAPEGTEFQQRVWHALQTIPYGQTASYRDIAGIIANNSAFRAVGNANGKNPICIIIPCHRIIAADGTIGGYSSGLEMKRWLLKHEQAHYREKQAA
jgi:methylated-DNA-[protein]-cysteine S-methyltransferase